MYWSSDPHIGNTGIQNNMPKNRFEELSQYLHFSNSEKEPQHGEENFDRLYKVRSLLLGVLENSQKAYEPSKNLSINEGMIAFKGRLLFREYMPAKLTKYGIKVWMAADSQNGYVNNFSGYLGKEANAPSVNGPGYDVVMKMASPFLKKHKHIFFDNIFYQHKAYGRSACSRLLCLQHSSIQSQRLAAMCKEQTVAGGKSLRSARQNNFYQMARQKRHFVLVHKCFT